jgi:hypothetical protein
VIHAEFDTLNHLIWFPEVGLRDETRRVSTPFSEF